MSIETKAIAAEDTFTDWIRPKLTANIADNNSRFLNISIAGTWVGTVTLQRRFSSDDDPRDVEEFTANSEEALYDHEIRVEYRIGIKAGGYTSGTCNVRLGA